MKRFLVFLTVSIVVLYSAILVANDGTSPSPDGLPDWVKSTGLLAGIAGGPLFAIWYAYYMTTNRIPAIEKIHKEQIEEMQEQHVTYIKETNKIHADHIALLTTNFRADINSMWTTKREDDKLLVEALRGLGDRFLCRYPGGLD